MILVCKIWTKTVFLLSQLFCAAIDVMKQFHLWNTVKQQLPNGNEILKEIECIKASRCLNLWSNETICNVNKLNSRTSCITIGPVTILQVTVPHDSL